LSSAAFGVSLLDPLQLLQAKQEGAGTDTSREKTLHTVRRGQ